MPEEPGPLQVMKESIDLGKEIFEKPGNDNTIVSVTLFPFFSFLRTYEMELRLSDPKKKDDDMGVILVDVCMMFRDATIKKGLVREFLLWLSIAASTFPPASITLLSFSEMGAEEKQGMELNFF